MGILREIQAAVSGHGHGCTCESCGEAYWDRERRVDMTLVWRFVASCVLYIAALATARLPAVSTILCVAVILTAGYDVLIRAAASCVRELRFDETLLMSLVAVLSVVIGEGREGAAVMLLFRLGQIVQGGVIARVRAGIDSVMEDRPEDVRTILSDIRAAAGRKSAAEEFISHFTRIYTPAVLGISLLIAVISPLFFHTTVTQGIHRALVLLVIACPCAAVISVPLAYYAGAGGALRQGVLFHDAGVMEDVTRVTGVVIDKKAALEGTGLRVVSVKSGRMEADVFLRIAAHACAYSGEAMAECIKSAYQGTIYIELIQSFEEDPGRGIAVQVEGVDILLGTEDFMREHGVDPGEDVLPEACVYLSIDGKYTGRIVFGNVARENAAATVSALSWDRDRLVALVSEDTAAATEKFARSVGIGQYYSDCGPEEKTGVVRDLKSRQLRRGKLLYLGSAETDPDCFCEADVAASLNGGTSNAAIREADVAVMDGAPFGIITALEAAKSTRTIVRQNILFVLAFTLVILAVDMFGLCPLWLAVLADVGVALAAILNAARGLLIRPAQPPKN